ncbi:hypothetical protein EBZ39_04045 [bacterium]|nr:hypothetical protein [bacterium]
MPLEITSLRELSPEKIAATVATLAQLMQERHPDVELTRGVFHDLVLYFNGVLNTAVRENIDRVLQSRSLLQITQNPALSEAELVDHVLSNFNVTRNAGAAATGAATLVFLLDRRTVLPAGIEYTTAAARFQATEEFTILPTGSTATQANERVMIAVGDGTFAATIPLVATAPGVAGNIKRGTKFFADSIPGNVSEAFAATDFVSGREPATNEEYLDTLAIGITAATIGSRKSYEKFIRAQPAFKNILHCSVLGCGDPEQQRDQHSLFPISGGGKIDIYLQTTAAAQEIDHTLEATYVGIGENGTIWQVAIPRDAHPGFYEVSRAAKLDDKTSNGYEIVYDRRGVDLTQIDYVPDIIYAEEGAYTRYQTAIVRFEDKDTLSSGLTLNKSKANYRITTRGMPLIGDIHDTLSARDNRPRATDLLVKAAVPCFTKIAFEIRTENNEVVDDTTIAAMKKEIVAAIAGVGFSGQLHSSVIAMAAHKFLTGRQAIGGIDMFGRIRRPNGSTMYLRDNTLLVIPNDPARFVTGRTTAFVVGVDDVAISYTAAGFTA